MTQESLNMFKSSTKLYFLAFVMCVAIAGIGFMGIHQLQVMNRNVKSLYEDRLFPIEQLTTIRYAYGFGIFSTIQQLQDNSISHPVAIKKITASQESIRTNWQAYKLTYLTPKEKKMVNEAEILMIKAERKIVELNKNLEKGKTYKINKSDLDLIPPVLDKINELVQLQLLVSRDLNINNERIYYTTTNKFYIIITTSLFFAVLLSFYIVGDTNALIRRLKIVTQKMLESEEKSRAYIEYAGDGILIFAEDLALINFNSAICKMLDYKKHEMEGFRFNDFFFNDDLEQNPLRLKMVQENNGLLTERNLKKKDGTVIETEINTKPLFGGGYIAIIRDITERKQTERELISNNIQLKKINSELDSFVYQTTHDLRSPLTSLLGLIRITDMEVQPEQIEFKNKLSMMEKMVRKLDDLIGDILDYSRNSRLEVAHDEIDFEEIIKEVNERLLFMKGADAIKIKVDIHQDIKFISDRKRVEIIFGNLISNAIKYQDIAKESRFINISVRTDNKKAIITVEDNGVGIVEENKEKIFEIFYRASKISTGSGLGLYIVKEAVEKLKGTLSVESEFKIGTKFIVNIPNLIKS